jgi:fibronectin type 3 domain-containing protein
MGASEFMVRHEGKTAKAAFRAAVEQAQYDSGHGGYTGTIAEKDEFVLISVPEGKDPIEFAEELLKADDDRVSDKWGPCGCVKIKEGEWFFFGWASS